MDGIVFRLAADRFQDEDLVERILRDLATDAADR